MNRMHGCVLTAYAAWVVCVTALAQGASQAIVSSSAAGAWPIRVAVYDDQGSETAAAHFDRVLGSDPKHFVLKHVSAQQIRDGALKGFDIVIQGGGGSRAQAAALQTSGRDAIRTFVQSGGGYLGVCAGAYLAASDKDYQLGILNARVLDREHWARGRGDVVLDVTPEGQHELKYPQDKATVMYHQGPLLAPDDKGNLPAYTKVATFETEVALKGAPHGVMQGTTAMASSSYGKGRVFVISPHPEQTPGYEGLVRQAVAWAADRDLPTETPR